MQAGQGSQQPAHVAAWRALAAIAALMVAGAVYLSLARAEALLLDLGRFVGCL